GDSAPNSRKIQSMLSLRPSRPLRWKLLSTSESEVSQLAKKVIAKDLVISGLQKEFDERTAWALRLKEEVEAKDLAIRRWKEKVKAKDLVIVGLHKRLSRRPVEILKRILGGNRS